MKHKKINKHIWAAALATDLNLKLRISFVLVIHKHKAKHSVKIK